ncbi:serine protease filzig [Venturia canescens]|uniref:serine protease filzig n=1 Tax=Venturia canescens TaxID=32260 RepID=UPI001C9D23A0|nr:serine protease filzig [Venturia canescens]XP_043284595.1 serine protease filzig [Venturia canescens]
MTSGKIVCVLAIACLAAVSPFSVSHTPQSKGRKLFGGYRIVPKVCQPTNPSRIKSNDPPICMFNYECSRRNGEVVGACMDGFLFGACCQLPPKSLQGSSGQADKLPGSDDDVSFHEIDHVPDVPILLNADGTPVGISLSDVTGSTSFTVYGSSDKFSNSPGAYTKITTLNPPAALTSNSARPDNENVDLSKLETDFPALLGQQETLDGLRLPGLITHTYNDIQDHQDHGQINPVTTLLSPDQIVQIADPVDQLPALFAQGLGQNNHTEVDTVLLNANGTRLDENNISGDLFKPQRPENQTSADGASFPGAPLINIHQTSPSPISTVRYSQNNGNAQTTATLQQYANVNRITGTTSALKYTGQHSSVSNTPIKSSSPHWANGDNNAASSLDKSGATTPMSTTRYGGDEDDDLVRVPTITYDVQSGNKKHDELDREEIAINHIISILNATTPSGPTRVSQQVGSGGSSVQTWVSFAPSSKPTPPRHTATKTSSTTEMFPYTFYNPGRPSTYYHYETQSTQPPSSSSSSHSTPSTTSPASPRPHTSQKPEVTSTYGSSSSYSYTTRSTINPPAPTVIVLGPLGTEYTTITTQKPATRKPTSGSIRPSLVTKLPSVGTTITHNISTVISTSSAATSNNHVVSTSYISVNLKDNTSPKPIQPVLINQAVESETEAIETPTATKRPSTIWTTLSSWSSKPSFHLKPSQPDLVFPTSTRKPIESVFFKETTTPASTTASIKKTTLVTQPSTSSDEETAPPDDLINFPPVRNPNLTQQEKPTLVESFNNTGFPDIDYLNGNDIPTPSFIEDDVLTNKVDVFVHKIVESLGENFQDLKDVVYGKKNVTAPPPQTNTATKKPPTKKPLKPPSGKPSATTAKPATKKPTRPNAATQKPADKPLSKPTKIATTKPRPTNVASVTTKKPASTVTKRPKPQKKPTSPPTTTSTTTAPQAVVADTETPVEEFTDLSAEVQTTTPDYRKECGVRPLYKSGRIVGGKGATFGEWPWQVLVREATWLGLFTKNKCGGVLLTNNYVITAAHCQPGFLATLVAVFGEFDISGELESKRSITRNVRRVIVNRGYNPATFENDLALLELEKPVQFDAHIVPICMPEDGADFTGRLATVTGWGRVKYNGGTPSVLQEVQVPIIKNSVCQDMFRTAGHSKLILDSFLCAGYASGQKDSCEGDSGGPLMMEGPDGRWILVGTVSHGIKCAAPYLPGVYMKTTFFKPWLHSVTGV